MTLLYGVAVLILLWWLSKLFTGLDPKKLARFAKTGGGVLSLGVAALLMMRGRLDMALFVGGIGAWLLGWSAYGPGGLKMPEWARDWGGTGSAGRSKVASALLEMELDHDSGGIKGKVRAGAFAGRDLDDLTPAELSALLRECLAGDPDGARLLEAYLDRRAPGWREDADRHRDAGQRGPARSGAMSDEEAYEILGLQPGAGQEAIREAHRGLMKRIHPDAGGTSGLAARVNQAKDTLLKKHG